MTYKAGLYFNYQVFKDVIYLIIDNLKTPDYIKINGDFVGLYCENKLVGINILNSNKYIKLRLIGQLNTFNKEISNLFNSLIKTYLNEDVILQDSSLFLGQIKDIKGSKYIIDINQDEIIANSIINENIKVGDFVIFTKRDSFIYNGNLANIYLENNVNYLILLIEDEDYNNSYLGLQTTMIS